MSNKSRLRFVISALLVSCMAFLLLACQHAPLAPDHGYPSAWPKPTVLAKGGAELGGTYANHGIATTSDGSVRPITLAGLIPRRKPLAQRDIELPGKPIHEDSVKLVVLPPRSLWEGSASLQAFIATGGSIEGYEIETASDENVLLYGLNSSSFTWGVGFSGSQTRVFLARGEDGSLIARIHGEDYTMALLVPYISSKYTWARFERIKD